MDQITKEKIEYVIDKFNFERVHVVMQTLEWRWVNLPDYKTLSVPNIIRLKTSARDLMSRAYSELMKQTDQNEYICGSGGLEAVCWADTENIGEFGFTLKFVLTEYTSEDYVSDED